jgi:hypothetical protein
MDKVSKITEILGDYRIYNCNHSYEKALIFSVDESLTEVQRILDSILLNLLTIAVITGI